MESNLEPSKVPIFAPSPRDLAAPTVYQKLPQVKETYLAYVVAVRDPLNFHLDIYWPTEMAERYSSAIRYDYSRKSSSGWTPTESPVVL